MPVHLKSQSLIKINLMKTYIEPEIDDDFDIISDIKGTTSTKRQY